MEPGADQMTSEPGEHYLKSDIGNVKSEYSLGNRMSLSKKITATLTRRLVQLRLELGRSKM